MTSSHVASHHVASHHVTSIHVISRHVTSQTMKRIDLEKANMKFQRAKRGMRVEVFNKIYVVAAQISVSGRATLKFGHVALPLSVGPGALLYLTCHYQQRQ